MYIKTHCTWNCKSNSKLRILFQANKQIVQSGLKQISWEIARAKRFERLTVISLQKSESQQTTANDDGGSGARDRSGISIDGRLALGLAVTSVEVETITVAAPYPPAIKTEVDESGKRTWSSRARACLRMFVFCCAIGGRPIREQRAPRTRDERRVSLPSGINFSDFFFDSVLFRHTYRTDITLLYTMLKY